MSTLTYTKPLEFRATLFNWKLCSTLYMGYFWKFCYSYYIMEIAESTGQPMQLFHEKYDLRSSRISMGKSIWFCVCYMLRWDKKFHWFGPVEKY